MTKGLIFSQGVLLALITKGLSRKRAYELVQKNAMRVWKEGVDLKTLLIKDANIRKYLNEEEIKEIFDFKRHLRHVETIFSRIFG